MRKDPKWRRNPAARPQQILGAALETFAVAGVSRTTIDEIAEAAGLSKGTIYLYFPDKEALFRETIANALAGLRTDQPPPGSPVASQQLRATIGHLWQFLTSPAGAAATRLANAEQWQFPEVAELFEREVVTRFVDAVSRIIRRGIQAGEFRQIESRVGARMIAALTLQTARSGEGGPFWSKGKSSQTVLRELADFYLQSIERIEEAFPQADGAPIPRGFLNN